MSRRTTTRPEVRISFGGATFWLSTIVPQGWGELRHKTRTNGAWEASWVIPAHPRNRNWRHPALVYGARVEIMLGPVVIWAGALGEPDWDAGRFIAIGVSRDGETAVALDGSGNASTKPNEVIDAAIARGVLSWTRVGDFGTTAVGDANSGLVTVQSVLDAWAQKNGSRWKVNRQRQLVIEPLDEANPKWFITPGSGALGTADEDRVDRVFVRFTNTATGARDMASYPSSSPVGGIEKPKDLITNRAPMSTAAAQAEAQAIWSELAGRSGFTSGWTLTRGQVTGKGGPLADLAFVEGGDGVCALGAPDPRGVALNTNVLLGEADYEWTEDSLQANPVGTAARDEEAVLEQVGNLAVDALTAASAGRAISAFPAGTTAFVGANPPAGTPVITKTASAVAAINGSGYVDIDYIGGAFPNGVVSVVATLGDRSPTDAIGFVLEAGFTTLTKLVGQPRRHDGAAYTGGSVRINYTAIGW